MGLLSSRDRLWCTSHVYINQKFIRSSQTRPRSLKPRSKPNRPGLIQEWPLHHFRLQVVGCRMVRVHRDRGPPVRRILNRRRPALGCSRIWSRDANITVLVECPCQGEMVLAQALLRARALVEPIRFLECLPLYHVSVVKRNIHSTYPASPYVPEPA